MNFSYYNEYQETIYLSVKLTPAYLWSCNG